MTQAVQAIAMLAVAVSGLLVVTTRDPLRQVIVMGAFSIALLLLFTVLQAPDVTLSAIGVGSFAYPALVLLTLAKIKQREKR